MKFPVKTKSTAAMMLIIAAVFIGFSTITTAQDEKLDEAKPAKEAKEDVEKVAALPAILKEYQAIYVTAAKLTIDDIKTYYDLCEVEYRENTKHEGFKKLRDNWAELWIKRSNEARDQEQAVLLMEFADAGYASAEAKFELCLSRMMKAGNATMAYKQTGTAGLGRAPAGRFKAIVKPIFEKLAFRVGWEYYSYPEEFDEFNLWFLDAMKAYWAAENAIRTDQDLLQLGLMSPTSMAKLKAAEKAVFEEAKALKAQDEKDGFAINARQTFARFLNRNRSSRRYNIRKGRRAFCPSAVGRGKVYAEGTREVIDEGEKIEDIWTYTYAKPFIIYVEKPIGGEVDLEHMESISQKAVLLAQANEWFQSNIVEPMELTRQLPLGHPYTVIDKDGKRTSSETPAQKAAREEWPLELVMFKDSQTFINWASESTGSPLPAGVRAFYSSSTSTVITWDSKNDLAQTDNLEALTHEVFHQLSDHYAANPQDPEEEGVSRLRYSTVLVQEGLTESIAAFEREGSGSNATYKFVAPNKSRIQFFFKFQDVFIGDFMFARMKDLVRVQHYGHIWPAFKARAKALKDKIKNKNLHRRFHSGDGLGMGIYYSAACMAGYFFYHYEVDGEYPYRDVWWEFIRQDYTDELADAKKVVSGYSDPDKVEAAFAKVFGLESDADWEALDKEFWEFTLTLKDEYYDADEEEEKDE